MPLATWLKKTQLKRVERKLRRLRALQRRVRDKEAKLKKEHDRGLANEEYQRKHKAMHDEKEDLTREINHLIVTEERLKGELRAAEGSAPST